MKNILLANTYYKPCYGGVENSLYHMGQTFNAMNYHSIIMASDDCKKGYRLIPREHLDQLEVWRYRRYQNFFVLATGYIQDVFQSWYLTKKLSRSKNIDAIFVRSHLLALGIHLALYNKTPLIYIIPGVVKYQDTVSYDRLANESLKGRLVSWYAQKIIIPQSNLIQKLSMKHVDKVVVFSENMKQQVQKAFPFVKSKLILRSPGVDTNRFAPSTIKSVLRKEFSFDENDFVCLIIGRLTPAKRFDLALKAISKSPNANIKLLVVGDGPQGIQLKNEAQELGILDRVRFIGASLEPEKFYKLADAFIMTSVHETFGQTILEAMASALPVIAFCSSDSNKIMTASSEIIEDGIHGILCPFGEENLVDAIFRLQKMPINEREEMGQFARITVIEKFSWQAFCTDMLQLVSL